MEISMAIPIPAALLIHQRFLWHQLTLASYEFYVQTIFYVKNSFISILSFFLVFKRDFIR